MEIKLTSLPRDSVSRDDIMISYVLSLCGKITNISLEKSGAALGSFEFKWFFTHTE